MIKNYEGNQIGKITELHLKESDLDYADDPRYVYDERITPGNYHAYRPYSLPNMVQQHLRAGPDCAVLIGMEKPRFFFSDNGDVYWTIDDFAIGEIMNVPYAIPFFLDKENPELVACIASIF